MTTPGQPDPYPDQSGAGWAAAAPGQGAAPYPAQPQPGAGPYNYGWPSPAYGYPQATGGQASAQDRGAGILLLLGAALAVAGSFPALTTSVDTTSGTSATDSFTSLDKAWSFVTQSSSFNASQLQLLGLPLALGAAAAVAVGILLLTGFGARRVRVRSLALTVAGILFGATLTVLMVAVDDGQFDTSTRHTSFGPGFWLVVLSATASLGAAVPGIIARFGSSPGASQGTAYGVQTQPAQLIPQPQQGYAPPQPQSVPQAQTQQYPAQPAYSPPPQFGPGAGWAQPGQASAPASPEDPQQPTG